MVVPTGLGLLMLLRAVRAKAGNVLKIDPDNPLHAVSLSMSLWIPLLLAATLGIGLDTLAMQLEMQNDLTEQPPVSVGLLWLQAALFVLIALIGTGWLTRRSWSATLARLRIVRPSPRDAAIGIGWALGMVPAVMLLEAAAQTLGVGIDADVDALTEQLIGPLIESPWGIVSIGLAAGIGEEALFRGALLPRFGRVYTALLFALLHSNYGITLSTVVVFLLGLMLGWLATRYNTTTAMIAHAVYNSTLALLAVTAVQVLNQQ
jgi:membrane protease YdiL (CAAX protease family)